MFRAWTPESDMYSFGVLIFEVYSFGLFPFEAIADDTEFIQLLADAQGGPLSDRLQLNADAPVTPVVLELLHSCLDRCAFGVAARPRQRICNPGTPRSELWLSTAGPHLTRINRSGPQGTGPAADSAGGRGANEPGAF